MKLLTTLFPLLLLLSCSGDGAKVDELNRRINRLEQRLDSLTGRSNSYSSGSNHTENFNSSTPGALQQNGRCQQLTKKGTQCKRKARGNGYCWQHGG